MKNKHFYVQIASLLFFLLISGTVFAAIPNLTTVPAGDLSKTEIIDFLFGPIVSGGSGANPLGDIVGVFNGIVLMLGGLLVAYTLLVGTLSTAHEGEMLGRKWSSVWIPLRISLGSALLLPAPGLGGFCLMQAVVAWMAIQGIGFADNMWATFNQNPLGGGIYTPADTSSRYAALTRDLLLANVCMASIDQVNAVDTTKGSYAQALTGIVKIQTLGQVDLSNGIRKIAFGQDEDCGSMKLNMPPAPVAVSNLQNSIGGNDAMMSQANQIQYQLSDYQWSQAQALNAELLPIAQTIVSDNPPTEAALSAKLEGIIQKYVAALKAKSASVYASEYQSNTTAASSGNSQGWITAGAYYMQISRLMNAVSTGSGNFPSVGAPPAFGSVDEKSSEQGHIKIDCGWWRSSMCKQYAGHIVPASEKAVELMASTPSMANLPGPQITQGKGGSGADGFLTTLVSMISQNVSSIMSTTGASVMTMGQSNQDVDPIIFAQNLGNSLVDAGWAAIGVTLVLSAISGPFLPGLSSTLGQMGLGLGKTIMIAGASLSIILPMLPFLIWLGAILGWIVLLIEAIVGAPLVCLSIIAPDGDGIVGRAGQGYMLILSLTLKPVLMIFGLIASIVLMKPLGHLINIMFFEAFNVAVGQSSSSSGLTATITGIFLYAITMLGLTKKVFDLIHTIPDGVLRWIGAPGGSELGSAAHATRDADRQAMAAVGAVAAGATAVTGAAQRGIAGAGKSMIDKKNQDREKGINSINKAQADATENRKSDEQQSHMAAVSNNPASLEKALMGTTNSRMNEAQQYGKTSDTKTGKPVYQKSSIPGMDSIPSNIPQLDNSNATFAQKREVLANQLQTARATGNSTQIGNAKTALDNFDNKAMDLAKPYIGNDTGLPQRDRNISEAAQSRSGMFQARAENYSQQASKNIESAQSSLSAAAGSDPSSFASAVQSAGGVENLIQGGGQGYGLSTEAEGHLAQAKQSFNSAHKAAGVSELASSESLSSFAPLPDGYRSPNIKLEMPQPPSPSSDKQAV